MGQACADELQSFAAAESILRITKLPGRRNSHAAEPAELSPAQLCQRIDAARLAAQFSFQQKARIVKIEAPDPGEMSPGKTRGDTAGAVFRVKMTVHAEHDDHGAA
jgi:hypothetical protein